MTVELTGAAAGFAIGWIGCPAPVRKNEPGAQPLAPGADLDDGLEQDEVGVAEPIRGGPGEGRQ